MRKRLIALVMAIAMVMSVSSYPVTVIAETGTEVKLAITTDKSGTLAIGDEINVNVDVLTNPGVNNITAVILFDVEQYEFIKFSKNKEYAGDAEPGEYLTINTEQVENGKVLFMSTADSEFSDTGTYYKFKLKVRDTAKAGAASINFKLDAAENDSTLYAKNKTIYYLDSTSVTVPSNVISIPVTGITINGADSITGIGNTTQLTVEAQPANATQPNTDAYEFYALGLGDPIEVSAVHGHGTGDLLDACVASFPPDDGEEYDEDVIKVAIIGKPNVGKSSLLNKILGEERVIVSNIAGTTRDAIDSYFENESGKFLFIDTAGMRRKSKVDDAVEKYSNLRSIAAIERADVCLILIDANEGVTEQDTKVAGLAHEAGKACIIVVNKWDTVEKDTNTMDEKTAEVRRDLSYMTYAPVVFISALTGQRVDKLFDMIVAVSNQNSMRITTGMLNNILEDATARVQPPTDKGRRLKIYYITQVGVKPPHFVFFCNDSRLFHFSYQRYLENQIRAVFGLTGTPIRITIRQKGDKEDM